MSRREAALQQADSPPGIALASADASESTKPAVLESSSEEWGRRMVGQGYPAYRARQLLDWIIRRRADSFELMSDLPRSLRQRLDAEWAVFGARVVYHDVAPDGTDKLVLECRDGRRIECVLMAEGQPPHSLPEQSSRLRNGVCLLCQRFEWI